MNKKGNSVLLWAFMVIVSLTVVLSFLLYQNEKISKKEIIIQFNTLVKSSYSNCSYPLSEECTNLIYNKGKLSYYPIQDGGNVVNITQIDNNTKICVITNKTIVHNEEKNISCIDNYCNIIDYNNCINKSNYDVVLCQEKLVDCDNYFSGMNEQLKNPCLRYFENGGIQAANPKNGCSYGNTWGLAHPKELVERAKMINCSTPEYNETVIIDACVDN